MFGDWFLRRSKKKTASGEAVDAKQYAQDDPVFEFGWMKDNGGKPLDGAEVERLLQIVPSDRQLAFHNTEFMLFVHFGMNTFYDREWGTGKENPAKFNPEHLDTDQWCRAAKAAGARGIILTCKHHDGFCLFQTAYTGHSVKNSPWKNGKGDVLAELVESCKKYDLKVGVYLSPWDRNSPLYGTKAYDDYFVNQLTELLTNYGEIFEVWFDGAKGKNAPDFTYDWQRYYETIRRLQPEAVISVCGPDVRWCGNEAGQCRESEWNVVSARMSEAERIAAASQQGENDTEKLEAISSENADLGSREVLRKEKALIWYPAEVDVSIRKGWFYHKKQDKTVKSLKKLLQIYYASVGGNASLLLNVCPDKSGRFAKIDVARLEELGDAIRERFAVPVKKIETVSFQASYFDLTFDAPAPVRTIMLAEDLTKSQRVEQFDLYVKRDGAYRKAFSGTTIGSKKIVLLPEDLQDNVTGVRLHVLQSRGIPQLNLIGVYA